MNKTIITVCLAATVALLIFPFLWYGSNIMVVTSDSMLPTLKPNDLLLIQKTEINEIKVGDIIVFNSHIEGIDIIAHRAIEKLDNGGKIGIKTQGDNIDEQDTWIVYEEDLIGKVSDHISYVGILLIEPVRYSLVAVIIITAVSLLKEITSEAKLKKWVVNSANLC